MPLTKAKDQTNYLSAVPTYTDFTDFVQLLSKRTVWSPQDAWKVLFHQKQALFFNLPEEAPLHHPLYHLYFEQQNQKKLHQTTPLHLGFPMLIWNDHSGITSAPLFLIEVEIHPKSNEIDHWMIKVRSNSTVFVNPLLDFPNEMDHFWEKPDFELPTLSQLQALANFYDAELQHQEGWINFPNSKDWPSEVAMKNLAPSIVLGLFESQEKYHHYPLDQSVLVETTAKWRHQFTIPDLDPHQRAVLNHQPGASISVVTGGPGSGKKHLTEALLLNALSNHKKVLLISGKPTNIPGFQHYLDRLQLGHLSFWLHQEDQDLNLLLALLRNPSKVEAVFSSEQELRDWQKQVDELQQYKQRYDSAFRAVNSPIFGSTNWSQTVGLYLKAQKQAGKAILSSELSQKDFQFNVQEYETAATKIQEAQFLFEAIKSIRHPLRALHPNLFLTRSQQEAHQFTQQQLNFFLEQLTNLQQEYIQLANKYKQKLNDHFDNYYRLQMRQIEDLELSISNNINAYGKDFELSSKTALQFIGIFSGRVKKIAQERNKLNQTYETLLENIKPMPELQVHRPTLSQNTTVRQISDFLDKFKTNLIEWKQTVPSLIEQHLKGLNYQNAIPQLNLQAALLDLEAKLDQIIEELNHCDLLATPQTQPMLTLPKRQHKTEQLMDFLEGLQINLDHFPAFYQWQHFWLQQDDNTQALIKAIIRAKPLHWVIAFENWYLQQLLDKKQATNLPQKGFIDPNALKKLAAVQQKLAIQINTVWETARQELAKAFRKKEKHLGIGGDLSKRFAEHGKSITNALPLFFSTPIHAVKSFSDTNYPFFDLIIFESAQFIDEQIGRYLQRLGKQQIIIGNDQFIKDDEKADFLEYILKEGILPFQLKNIHKYYPGNLFQLLNGTSITEKAIEAYQVKTVSLAGHYHEELGINSAEVHYIIQFLQNLERTPQRTYPSIAIVCNTIKQRNYISKAIFKIKLEGNFEEKENFLQMERNGLMILHLSELEASRFDCLLYCFTYGVDKKHPNQFTAHAGVLNTPAGLRQLNELMSTASQEIQIIHSIPEGQLQAWASAEDEKGFFILANYLQMIQGIQNNDSGAQKAITQNIRKAYPLENRTEPQLPIYHEIAAALEQLLPEYTYYFNFQKAHLKVPLLIQDQQANKLQIAIIVDYFLGEAEASDFNWEIKQREMWRQAGILILTTYSIDWWKHPEKAALQLADQIKLTWTEQK